MNNDKLYQIRQVKTVREIKDILLSFNSAFSHDWSEGEINAEYTANKLSKNAIVLKAFNEKTLGFIAFYANDNKKNSLYLIYCSERICT